VAERVFTVEEANALLDEVRPLAEQMVRHRQALSRAMARQERLEGSVRGNGGGISPEEPGSVAEEVATEAAGVARCLERIQALGAVVKDLDAGLVDFPSVRGDEEVFLCWHVGEDEIRYWHGREEGFAGRKEL
jgi:hypothetical protein